MKTKLEDFVVHVPNLDGTAVAKKITIKIPLNWDKEFGMWVLAPEANRLIEDTKAEAMGLLLPAQLKELRLRLGFSQKEMGELFQVGFKSWTRWESGKHRATRSINLLIRALYDGEISVNYLLKRAGKAVMPAKAAPLAIKTDHWRKRMKLPQVNGMKWNQHQNTSQIALSVVQFPQAS